MEFRELVGSMSTCSGRLPYAPWWRCDLPMGHPGDHASISVRHFPRDTDVMS